MSTAAVRSRRAWRAPLVAAVAAASVVALPTAADARPVITGAGATATRNHPQCPRVWCLRVTFRTLDPALSRGARLRWRVLAYRYGDDALVGNWFDVTPNNGRVNVWWLWPKYALRPGVYVARVVVTSSHGKARVDRFFRVTP